MNSTNLSGTIQRVTVKQTSDNQYCLGSIAVYRQYNKEQGKAIYDYIDFIAWGETTVQRLQKGNNVALSGTLQSYLKDTNGPYKQNVLQLHVNHVDSFGTSSGTSSSTNASYKDDTQDSDNPFGHKMDYKGDDLEVTNEDLPGFLQGGNN